MIDWTEINKSSSADWIALAERLLGRAQAILTTPAPDADALRAVQKDLGEFVNKANLSCPVSAINAARRVSDQITIFLTSLAITDLERRNDKLDAVKARMSSAANELRADAASIRLEPIQNALAAAIKVSAELKGLITEVEGIPKADIPARISAVAKQANRLVKEIESGLSGHRA